MKPFILGCALVIAATATAQNPNDPDGLQKLLADKEVVIAHLQTPLYFNGIRLDSIEATYATFAWEGSMLYFDYGVYDKNTNSKWVTNAAGKKALFKNGSLAGALNLMYYNGWEVVDHYRIGEAGPYFLLKKRQPVTAAVQ